VIITEGEFDAMAAYQATGIPAISLPYGASNLPPEMVNYLTDVKMIYLWMDFDEVGQLNISTYVEKLGASRTFIVKELTDDEIDKVIEKDASQVIADNSSNGKKTYKIKDANDALRISPALIRQYIVNAKTIPQMNIIKFSQLRELVRERIFHQDRFRGVPSIYFSWFNSILKGFRRGE
jgi:twinkle protein